MRYLFVLCCLLLVAPSLAAKPQVLRAEGRLSQANTEKNPLNLKLKGKLFSLDARAFVTDTGAVRIRVAARNLAGPQAFFSTHVGVFGKAGKLLGGGGKNDVYDQRKKGEESLNQWDILVPRADLEKAMTVQCVFYEDTTLIGRQ
ncbi:MAG: hypothetical protein AB7S38_31270 [Vulcanimicrobiota bacterium]